MKTDYKVPNGKLLRIEADIDNNTINSIKITGDFFMHPETALEDIERMLKGVKLDDVESLLHDYIEKNNMQVIGFSAKDLAEALRK